MGYDVDVIECNLVIKKGMEEVKEILEKFDTGDVFEIEGSVIEPVEWTFKWTGDEYIFFASLARVAEGYVAFRGEDGAYWKIELKDGKIIDYGGEIVYRKTDELSIPDDVLKERVIVNSRYLATFSNSKIVVYDRDAKKWLEKRFYGSLGDLMLINNIVQANDIGSVFGVNEIEKPDSSTLQEFMRKILEKYPAKDIKLDLLNGLV